MPELIQKHPSNTLGKDYIIGDLHGCYVLLERLLAKVNFDITKDRLFSVGDLIDRGPDSLRCLQLLDEPWFYAVMGNHEEMLLEYFLTYIETGILTNLDDLKDTGFIKNGGSWIKPYHLPERERMTDEFNHCLLKVLAMPLILVIGEGENRYNIVHGELVKPDNRVNEQIVWLDCDIDQWLETKKILEETYERLLWGRLLANSIRNGKAKFDTDQPGLATTFCGHTPTRSPYRIKSHLCIDTGGYLTLDAENEGEGFGLTLFDVQTGSWLKES